MFRYLFAKSSPDGLYQTPENSIGFSIHKKSGIRSLLFALALVSVVELVALHYFLSLWNHWVAWAASLSTVWLLLTIAAQFRAVGMCPIYVADNQLVIRNGMYSLMQVPVSRISEIAISRQEPDGDLAKKKTLHACIPASHNVIVKLTEPVTATLLYGKTKTVEQVLLAIDEPELLVKTIEAQAGG